MPKLTSVLMSAALLSIPAMASSTDQQLSLKHGAYVSGTEPCTDPPNADILVWDGKGFSGAHSSKCTSSVKELGGGRFEVGTRCLAAGDGSPNAPGPNLADTFVLKRLSRTSFEVSKESQPAAPYHWCKVKGVH